MIYLIVGQPRSGKSQYAVKIAFDIKAENDRIQKKLDDGKELKENELMTLSDGSIVPAIRQVFSDIDEHAQRNDFIKDAPKDWREVEDGSVIFYDEVHFRDEYLDQNKYMSQNPMIKELSTHGHRNIDIYLLTQDPRRLEKSIRALIFKMYLVKRPANLPPFANVYTFDRWLGDPWAASKNKDNVHDEQLFHYKKKYQEAYKSASSHTSISFKIQRKFIVAIVSIICMIGLSIFLFKASGMGKLVSDAADVSGMKEKTKVDDKKIMESASAKPATVNSNETMPEIDCRKAVNVEKPQCVDWFNNLEKNRASVTTGDKGQALVNYNPAQPFDNKIQESVQYQVTAKPVFSGCTKMNGKYQAYTQQGTKLDVSRSDCERLIRDNDRPFNYFATDHQNAAPERVSTSELTQAAPEPSSL
jgi:zona occludens toxin